MTYETVSSGVWQGLLADGTINPAKAAQKNLEFCGCQIRDTPAAIAELMNRARRMHWKKPRSPPSVESPGDSRYCRCRFPNYYPICETYVLYLNQKVPSQCPQLRPYAHILEELQDEASNRFAILVFSNCEDSEECNKKVLEEFDFIPRPKDMYHDYNGFSRAAYKLLEESIEYFEAPCFKLFQRLKKVGFTGAQDTYA